MQASSSEDESQISVELNGSLNDTAISNHLDNLELDQNMRDLNECLTAFITNELMVGIRLDNLEDEHCLQRKEHSSLKPVPWVYFLPHSVILHSKPSRNDMINLRDDIVKLNREGYSISYNDLTNTINIKVHNSSELTHYNIRGLKADAALHRHKELLDWNCLIDQLYLYYETFYEKLYFRETTILMLYWAYQKDLLSNVISEQALKLLVICLFINFGYGVTNVIYRSNKNDQKIKQFKKMISYTKIMRNGETSIDPELIELYSQYSVQEKRGFYMPTRKQYLQIKEIVPIYFPLLPMREGERIQEQREVEASIKVVLDHRRENMSICKNIQKIFKFLYNKLNTNMRVTIDFEEKIAYRHEYSEQFELECLHPVFNTSLCTIKDSDARKLRSEINAIHNSFSSQHEVIDIIKDMFSKNRG